MSVAYGKGAKGKATRLHSIIVRSIGECENCDYKCSCADKWKHGVCKLQAAHIEGRTASGTRTQLRNAYALCASCHRKFTDKPLTFSRFVTGTWAQQYRDRLLELSRPQVRGQKMDWDEELVRLKAMHDDIKRGEITINEAREIEHEKKTEPEPDKFVVPMDKIWIPPNNLKMMRKFLSEEQIKKLFKGEEIENEEN